MSEVKGMKYQADGHSKFDIKYHFVWVTKYCYKILDNSIRQRLKILLIQTYQSIEIKIISDHIARNHVHILVSYPQSLSPAKIAQYLKDRNSKMLQDEYPHLKKKYWGGATFWGARVFLCHNGNDNG